LLPGNSLARIYQVDDPILAHIRSLSLESGINSFSTAGPVSGYELFRHLEKINRSSLSLSSQQLYDWVYNDIKDPFSGRVWDISLDAAFESYWHENSNVLSSDWIEGYTDRAPFLFVDGETIFGNHAYGIISYALEKTFNESDFTVSATNNPLILNGGNSDIQNTLPHTAFIGFSNEWGTLVFGRDAVSLGSGNTGNLMVGSHVPYHDFLQGSLFNSLFKYTFFAIPMNELITGAMIAENLTTGNPGEAWIPWKDPDSDDEFYSWHTLFNGSMNRIYIAHRFEADFLPWWRMIMTEGTLFYIDSFDLRIFSPLMFNHNLQNFGEVNNTMGLECEITVSPHWMLDFQLFIDQLQTKGEQGDGGEIAPNALAALIGSRYQYRISDWSLKGFLEGVYTSPFAYLRTGDHTDNYDEYDTTQYNLDLVHAANMEDRVSGVDWLGYVYGPDSIVLAAELNAGRDEWVFTPSLRYIVQGERGLLIEGKKQAVEMQTAENINMLSPSGDDPMHSLVAGLGVTRVFPDVGMTVYTRNYWLNRWNKSGHSDDIQLMFGIRYAF
ncbi:MAG: hypothetical protein JXK93_03580, partial [Sphaerochaetaceae bacterium]|nr:hypothetical protein [Sphaerochaetaceae bacterium]